MRRILATLAVVGALLFSAGSAWSDLEDAGAAYDRGDYETAIREYRPLAEKGEASAQAQLGWMYDEGEGVPENDAEAAKWYLKAAEQGNTAAQLNLGRLYQKGEGVPQNYGEALKWFGKAADQGLFNAQYMLGYMYLKGWGVPIDIVQHYKWLKIAKRHGMDEEKVDEMTNSLWSLGLLSSSEVYEAEELARNWKPKSSSLQNLVEDLRSGNSNVRAVSSIGNFTGVIKFWREMKSRSDFKATVYNKGWTHGTYSAHSAEAAIKAAIRNCEEEGGGRTRCQVYAVGDNIVQGRSQAELADAIEAYQLEVSGTTAAKPKNGNFVYCRRDDGSVYSWHTGNDYTDGSRADQIISCANSTEITKAEYDRLKGKKTVTARKTPTSSHYCKRKDGVVYESKRHVCPSSHTEINKAEYDRLKNQKKDTASTTKSDTASSGDDPLEAKLEKLKKLLDKGLITEEEAAAKRAKLLEDL